MYSLANVAIGNGSLEMGRNKVQVSKAANVSAQTLFTGVHLNDTLIMARLCSLFSPVTDNAFKLLGQNSSGISVGGLI